MGRSGLATTAQSRLSLADALFSSTQQRVRGSIKGRIQFLAI
jgi:hypothetical protein